MTEPHPDPRWERFRYGSLLEAGGTSRRAADCYGSLVAGVEYWRDAGRRRIAERRIARWLGASSAEARRIFRAALRSEALEEADTVRSMRRPLSEISEAVTVEGFVPRGTRPRVYATLHFGSPVLAYLGLRAQLEPELRVIARELDETNPMPGVKRGFGRRKVAWVESVGGAPFLATDGAAVLRAREHLLAGNPLYAAVDVPGDVVDRADRFRLFGEPVVVASGLFRLAAMARADFQMVVPLRRGDRIAVLCRPPVDGADAAALGRAVMAEVEAVVREWPEEWWFWPFVVQDGSALERG
jgi:hypothetical protein